jgi:hypothetical protein
LDGLIYPAATVPRFSIRSPRGCSVFPMKRVSCRVTDPLRPLVPNAEVTPFFALCKFDNRQNAIRFYINGKTVDVHLAVEVSFRYYYYLGAFVNS